MKRKITTIDNLMEKMKIEDPESYKEIMDGTKKAGEEYSQVKKKGALVYIKDKEGFVTAKSSEKVVSNEIVITKEEYNETSGTNYYQKTFGRGGYRPGGGRPKSGIAKKAFSIKIPEELVIFVEDYSKTAHISRNRAVEELLKLGKKTLEKA